MHRTIFILTIFVAFGCSKQPEEFRIGDTIDSVIKKCERAGLEQTELQIAGEPGYELVSYMIDQSNYLIVTFDTKSRNVTGITKTYIGDGPKSEREERDEELESYP